MKFPRRRLAAPAPAVEPFPLLTGVPEAHIAVGSLSGVAPADIACHLLIVVDRDGRASMSGTACPEYAAMVLTEMAAGLARVAYSAHECGPGGPR